MPWVGKIIGDNNDTQFVLDAYSLVRYCVGYMTKGEKAHSDLYKLLLRLRREKGYDDKELLYRISSEALRSKETSAQEAAWVLLKFPMSEKSRMCQFIDTSPFGERTRCPKLMKDLESLPDDATDIWKPDIYDKYADRPESLESISLAVFAASYYNCNRKVNNFGAPVPRMKDRIIRYRKFKCKSEDTAERENYFRALVTLHVPWRNEVNDILKPVEEHFQFSSFEHMYNENLNCIMDGRRRFECNVDIETDLDKAVEKCVAEDDIEETEMDELIRRYVCGSGKYIFEEDEEYMDIDSQSINIDIPRNDFTSTRHVAALRSCADWTRDELNGVIRTLNRLQRFIVLLIIHEIRLRSKPQQLPPIGGESLMEKSKTSLAGAFPLWSKFSHLELTENMRQGEDRVFAEILRKIGGYETLTDDEPKNKANDRNEAIFNSARNLNTTQARGLPFKLIAVVGYSYLVTKNIDTADGLVNGAVGKLVWVEFGTVKKTTISSVSSTEEVVPKRLWMQFPGKTGSVANRKYRCELRSAIANAHIFKDKVHPYELPTSPTESEIECLVPIEREDLTLDSVWTESWRCVKRQQFPLTSALALTVFKIQGSTKDSVYTYYDPNISNAEVYVSFSRVTKLSGLYIDDSKVIPNEKGHYFQHPPSLDGDGDKKLLYKDLKRFKTRKHYKERYLAEEKRLREKSLSVPWQDALDLICENTKFLYHNVQSLHAHLSDIVMDEVYMKCDILFLAETHLLPSESVSMPCGFVEVARCDASSLNRSGGVAIFSKMPCSVISPIEIEEIEIAITLVSNKVKAAVVYCHKKPSCAVVIQCLETIALCEPKEVPIIICGDFNVEMKRILEHECFKKLQMTTCINLKSSSEDQTTYCDYGEGSCIDDIFNIIQHYSIDVISL
ncbi:hypothetical protein FOCC_FOCC016483 [Frankliniella occidentalis]|nr:hypothetical protein FOCC_FOCC016483 [Frankliniella occidentalis]